MPSHPPRPPPHHRHCDQPHHGHHRHRPHHRQLHNDREIETLEMLVREGDIPNIPDGFEILRLASRRVDPSGSIAAFLEHACSGLTPGTALLKLRAARAEDRERRIGGLSEWLLDDSSKRIVALIPPLPPHVAKYFRAKIDCQVLRVDHHPLPPHLRDIPSERIFTGPYHCREVIKRADLVVFDAFKDDKVFARQGVADLVGDCRILKPEIKAAIHFRPHPDDEEDVPLAPDILTNAIEV